MDIGMQALVHLCRRPGAAWMPGYRKIEQLLEGADPCRSPTCQLTDCRAAQAADPHHEKPKYPLRGYPRG